MNKKLMAAMLVPLMLILVAGFGYAAFTSTITESVTATAGTVNIYFTGTPSTTVSHSNYMTCNASISADGKTLTVRASNFAPGDTATVTFQIVNSGSLPANLSESISPTNISPFTYSDSISTGRVASIGAGGATVTVTATITLPAGTGNDYQGKSVSFNVTITATAGS